MLRKFLTASIFLALYFPLKAQINGVPPVDKSPMDMSYFPVNYPILKIQDKATEPLTARVIYSRPQKAGRTIFGGLVKNGEVWRLGANEATEIEFFRPVKISGKKIKPGRYTMYAIVSDSSWTLIINKETDVWGSFRYDPKKDVVRTEVTPQKTDNVVEYFSMMFEKNASGCNLIIAWDMTRVALPIVF
ncbi:MAG: DUF2911 domain-containing protein [Chitinophagaceae bacterium]|nr:DUF2911 domain-containing protein [Chitinophagaceae bacterium]